MFAKRPHTVQFESFNKVPTKNRQVPTSYFLGCFGRTSHFQTSIDLAPRLTGQVLVVQLRLFLGMVWYGIVWYGIYIYVYIYIYV